MAQRERLVITLAVVGSILMVGMDQWAGPSFAEARKLAQQSVQDRDIAQALIGQIPSLEQQAGNPDGALRASIAQLQRTLAEQEPKVRDLQKSLVSANRMTGFLENLLARNRALQLQLMETLPPVAVSSNAEAKTPVAGASLKLYKHGVRLRLAGSYGDLLGYLNDLEQSSQRVLWGDMRLEVGVYPKVEMTLTVYTLSLDQAWLTL